MANLYKIVSNSGAYDVRFKMDSYVVANDIDEAAKKSTRQKSKKETRKQLSQYLSS